MIDVVIPTYGKDTRLRATLGAIDRSQHSDVVRKILVIENGKKHLAEQICTQFSQLPLRYHHISTQGLVAARNFGISASDAPYLVFLDDDISVTEDFFIGYAKSILKHGEGFFFGGPLLAEYEKPPPEWLIKYLPWSAKDYHPASNPDETSNPIFLGGNMCISRASLHEVGGYEGLGASGSNSGGVGEENRLQQRLVQLGYRGICVTSALGHHWVPVDRCSEKFIAQRQRRHAYTEAFYDERIFPQIFQCPRWVGGLFLRSILGRLRASKKPEARLQAKIAFQRSIGLMQGYRDRTRSVCKN